MPKSNAARVSSRAPVIPGSILVVAPHEIMRDELRLARLGDYLHAEFPHLEFTVADRNSDPEHEGMVGVIPAADGSVPYTDLETHDVVGRVAEAVLTFLNYGERRH